MGFPYPAAAHLRHHMGHCAVTVNHRGNPRVLGHGSEGCIEVGHDFVVQMAYVGHLSSMDLRHARRDVPRVDIRRAQLANGGDR